MSVESGSAAIILDLYGTLARFGGDRDLFVELTTMLLEDAPNLFADVRRAADANDAAAVEGRAHALKGLLLNCGGVRAAKVAQQLEDAAHSGRITRGPELVDSLEDELRLLTEAIHNCRS